jgi:acetyl-CoA C-acetyltransferase
MQKFQRQRLETLDEMVSDVVTKALTGAGIALRDVDGVVFGSAVDGFTGQEAPELHALPVFGGSGRPAFRVSTSGSTAVTTPILGYHWVASGLADIVLVVCFDQMSPSGAPQAVFNTVYDELYVRPVGLNVPIQMAMEARQYLHRYGHTEEQMAKVSVKNHRNALGNPYAQLGAELTVDDVMQSPYIAWPVKRLDTSPTSDGARAVVFAREEIVKERTAHPVWVKGVGQAGDTVWFMGRRNQDLGRLDSAYSAASQAYEMAGISKPSQEIGVAEVYDPFTYKEMQHCEALGLCEEGGAGRMIDEGTSERGGSLPVNPSGGLLGEGNPIAACVSRLCWLYLQLSGQASGCQVPNEPRTGVCAGWGGMYQYSAVMVIGRDD